MAASSPASLALAATLPTTRVSTQSSVSPSPTAVPRSSHLPLLSQVAGEFSRATKLAFSFLHPLDHPNLHVHRDHNLPLELDTTAYPSEASPREAIGAPSTIFANLASQSVALTTPIPPLSANDPYDADDRVTHSREQSPQQSLLQRVPSIPSDQSSDSGRQHTLRRTPPLEEPPVSPPRSHIEAVSVGLPSLPRVATAPPLPQVQRRQSSRDISASNPENASAPSSPPSASLPHHPQPDSYRTHPALRITKNTEAAILFALEQALITPNPFTPDLEEENASMSDPSGAGPSGYGGSIRGANNGGSRMGPVPVGTPPNVRGPRDIMRAREEREERKRREQAALQEQAAQEAAEEAGLLDTSRQMAGQAGGIAMGKQRASDESAAFRGSGGSDGQSQAQRGSGQTQRGERRSGSRVTSGGASTQDPMLQSPGNMDSQGVGYQASASGLSGIKPRGYIESQKLPREKPYETHRRQRAETRDVSDSTGGGPSTAPGEGLAGARSSQPISEPIEQPMQRRANQSSFPHAFERWETLSAHWEGLTSFWIHRIEQMRDEIDRDPISQQLARQVTDLSAAGANLFHAVVELQRLRASSERKFQRWFFEHKQEQERAREVQGQLEALIQSERRERAEAIADAVAAAESRMAEQSNNEKIIAEMRRELQIAKDEARRAWEELGRRESDERERTLSLRSGQPTIVGGVQVVPMMQGVPSRHGSSRDAPPTREGPEPGGPGSSRMGGQAEPKEQRAYASMPGAEHLGAGEGSTATTRSSAPRGSAAMATAGGVGSSNLQYSHAPAVQPASASTRAYQHPHLGSEVHEQETRSVVSSQDGEYLIGPQGEPVTDDQGRPIRWDPAIHGGVSDEGSEDERTVRDNRDTWRHTPNTQGQYSGHQGSGYEYMSPTEAEEVDYTGAGYGAGWEAVPRHHHPTRLSDVLEEDERSRASEQRY